MNAKEHLARYLPVGQTLRDEFHDPPLGIGEAGPAKGGSARIRRVMQPSAQSTQSLPDSPHSLYAAKLLILRICLLKLLDGILLMALRALGHSSVLSGQGAGQRRSVLVGCLLQQISVAFDEAAATWAHA